MLRLRLYCGAWDLFLTYSLLWLLAWFFAGFGNRRSTNTPVLKLVAPSSRRPAPFAFLLYLLVWHLPPSSFGLGSRFASRLSGGYRICSLDFLPYFCLSTRRFCPSRWTVSDRVPGSGAKRRFVGKMSLACTLTPGTGNSLCAQATAARSPTLALTPMPAFFRLRSADVLAC